MQAPAIKLICEADDIRARMSHLLGEIANVKVITDGIPDLICMGCRREFPAQDLERAFRIGGGATIPILLVAWNGSEELAIQALRHGVREYLKGSASTEELAAAVHALCCSPESTLAAGDKLVGDSACMRSARAYIARVAKTSSKVLITGETGTGKELIAELIHRNSPRAHKALICINCAAIPDTLLESEMFGFERGAFTGAHASQDGKFKAADGGTVFLDEIGDMSPFAQAKILRVIERREVQRLGSNRTQHVDFRIIAATNRDLETLSKGDAFRQDLFFRLNVARIHMPPLRERPEDLLALAHYFRLAYNRDFGRSTVGFTIRAEQAIRKYQWPGNARELKNMVEAAFINLDPQAQWVDLPDLFCSTVENVDRHGADEVKAILEALSKAHWNKSRAAEMLSWSRMTLYRKMQRHGILSLGPEGAPLQA